ncbi:MAG: hypothetical protein WC860_01820 [Candidatus Margulisiibacteriota bacterium]|jgi:hypothetical protein
MKKVMLTAFLILAFTSLIGFTKVCLAETISLAELKTILKQIKIKNNSSSYSYTIYILQNNTKITFPIKINPLESYTINDSDISFFDTSVKINFTGTLNLAIVSKVFGNPSFKDEPDSSATQMILDAGNPYKLSGIQKGQPVIITISNGYKIVATGATITRNQ